MIKRKKSKISEIIIWILLICFAVFAVLPVYWAFVLSFKSDKEILIQSHYPFPKNPTLEQYFKLFKKQPFARFLLNSFIVSFVATCFALLTSTTGGYIFAKFNFPLKNVLFIIILATIMIPIQVYAIPLYLMIRNIGLINTLSGIIVPGIIMSTGIFFMKQNIEMIPEELIEAARIDGASELKIFLRIIVPLSRSPMIAISIISFTIVWNDFFWPLVVTSSKEIYTANLGLSLFSRQYVTDYGAQMAGSIVCLLPPLIIFIFLRKYILESIALSGLKG
ncbi:MAG: carbohydrate ABC transporter permease [Candidatus Asgardarchaeum sp.]